MFDLLAAADPREDRAELRAPIRRNDDLDGLADGFSRGITEQLFGGPVPGGDGAVERLGDDGVIGRFHDGAEQVFAIGIVIPLGVGLPTQPSHHSCHPGLQADEVDQQRRQNETSGKESVDPADIKA